MRSLILGLAVLAVAGTARADFVLTGTQHSDVTSSHSLGVLYDDSTADVKTGGSITEANVNNEAVLRLLAGSVTDCYAYNTSSVNMSGGRINGYLYAYDASSMKISGGRISGGLLGYLQAHDTSTVDMSGGTLRYDAFFLPILTSPPASQEPHTGFGMLPGRFDARNAILGPIRRVWRDFFGSLPEWLPGNLHTLALILAKGRPPGHLRHFCPFFTRFIDFSRFLGFLAQNPDGCGISFLRPASQTGFSGLRERSLLNDGNTDSSMTNPETRREKNDAHTPTAFHPGVT